MRSREAILANLDEVYRETFDRAQHGGDPVRMADLDSAYIRDQLMLEVLLDIRDLFAVTPAADDGKSALRQLQALRRRAGR